MKTAISVPDEIFELSEKIAKRLKVSRSAVFALGVEKLSKDLDRNARIARINKVCDEMDTSIDPLFNAYTLRKLRDSEWE